MLANSDREAEGLSTLTVSPVLEKAAALKASDMAEKGYFAHVTPEGYQPWYWFQKAGYKYTYAGENLAINFGDSDEVNEAWMKSPTHRANIMNGKYTEVGIATALGSYEGKSTVFVAQMFGTPSKSFASPAPVPTPAQQPSSEASSTEPAPHDRVDTSGSKTGLAVNTKTSSSTKDSAVLGTEDEETGTDEVSSFVAIENVEESNNVGSEAEVKVRRDLHPLLASAITNPGKILEIVLFGLSLLVIIAMFFLFFGSRHPKHPRIAFGGLVFILMLCVLVLVYRFV
jgi:hypothetical protein